MSVFSMRTKSSESPSSILKKSASIKSRLKQINTPTKVRFVLPHSKKVRVILRDFTKNINIREFENLVCLIRDAELLDEDISNLLKEATECISLLSLELRLFVESLLSINWTERNGSVVEEYQSFIVNLLSAHNYHTESVINNLVCFFIPPATDSEWINGVPGEDLKRCVHVHFLIEKLLAVVPMCKEMLLNSLKTHFPYYKKSAHIHEYYIHNLLWIVDYQQQFKFEIFTLIFSKLIVLDVNTPKEAIERHKNQCEDEIFSMDDDAMTIKTTISNPLLNAHTLDICLDKIFDYLITESHDLETAEVNWEKAKCIYNDLINIFDKIILPTYNTHHVQFVMFVLCSFKLTMAEGFLNYLWKKVSNPNVASVIRQSAVNYMVSFITRSTYIPLTVIKYTMQQLADWIHTYIANQDGLECINSDIRVHSVFYAICQALFYVVAFLHRDLVSTKKNLIFLESLNLGKMVTCRLNPLRVCQPAVVQNFAAVTRKYQLAYCFSIIEHNSRNTLPTIYKDEKGAVLMSNNILTAFYPFDPYILEQSNKKIQHLYRHYQQGNNNETTNNSNHEINEMEIDDFLDQHKCGSPQNYDFSYGCSPGFKHNKK